ncbi:hypothetical protein [Pseudomonas aeruginosa]|nr:hypothetical protein [Pseudomonas aeruginosa]
MHRITANGVNIRLIGCAPNRSSVALIPRVRAPDGERMIIQA